MSEEALALGKNAVDGLRAAHGISAAKNIAVAYAAIDGEAPMLLQG